MDSPRIAIAPAHSRTGSIVSICAFVRMRSAGPCTVEGAGGSCAIAGPDIATESFVGLSGVKFAARAAKSIAAQTAGTRKLRKIRRDILGLNSGERDGSEEQTLQSQFPAGCVVPFSGGVRAAALTAAAERYRGNIERERNVSVGGTALHART